MLYEVITNMAVFMPFISYWVFKLIRMKSMKPGHIFLAAFVAGYIGLVMAAILTAVEFGIQPLIATAADGKALYS